MKKITAEQIRQWFIHNDLGPILRSFEALQAELDKKSVPPESGMTVEEIRRYLGEKWSTRAHGVFDKLAERGDLGWNDLCKAIQPLTVAQAHTVQAFQPDWKEAHEWAIGAHIVFSETGEWNDVGGKDQNWKPIGRVKPGFWIDRPPKVTRERTDRQLLHAMVVHHNQESGLERAGALENIAMELAYGKTLHDLCTAAGISLSEEV